MKFPVKTKDESKVNSNLVVGRFAQNMGELHHCDRLQACLSLLLHFFLHFSTEKIEIVLTFLVPEKHRGTEKPILILKTFLREENSLLPYFEKAKLTQKQQMC